MNSVRAALGAVSLLACGCGESPGATAAPLEIGVKAADGTFQPLAEGDTVRTSPGTMGSTMLVPSVRAADVDPRAPEPSVQVDVGGFVLAANLADPRVDMVDDGTGYVLWDLRVQFQAAACCYACRDAAVVARLRDATGKQFEGHVTVQLDPGAGCPDVTACCATADACPDPSLTQLCR